MLNTSTIYNEPIKILSVQSIGAEISARAVESLHGQDSNIICFF